MAEIYCIGSAHLDTLLTFSKDPALGHTTPATSIKTLGGVAYNMAVVLQQLGNDVAFSGVVGYDSDAEHVINELERHNIDCSTIVRSKNNTGSYTALHSNDGELVMAAIDVAIYNELTPLMFEPIVPQLSKFKNWVLDSNFSPQSYAYLASVAEEHDINVYLTISSIYEGDKIIAFLPRAKALFGNVEEVQYLANTLHGTKSSNIWEAMQTIADLGTETIFATDGANGVYALSATQKIYRPTIPVANVVCVNGAGDTFAAAVIDSMLKDCQLLDNIDAGLLAAAQKISGNPETELLESRRRLTFMY